MRQAGDRGRPALTSAWPHGMDLLGWWHFAASGPFWAARVCAPRENARSPPADLGHARLRRWSERRKRETGIGNCSLLFQPWDLLRVLQVT